MNSNDGIHHLVEDLQKAVRDLTTRLDASNRHASVLLQRNSDLVDAYEAVSARNIKLYQDRRDLILKLRAERRDRSAKLAAEQQQYRQLKAKNEELSTECNSLAAERDRLASQLKAATRFNDEVYPQLTDLRRQFTNRGRELELEQQQYRQLEAEHEELRTMLKAEQQTYRDLENENNKLIDDYNALRTEFEALRPKRYSHACSLMFTVESADPEGEDITNTMLYDSVTARVKEVAWLNQWDDACLPPVESEEI